MTRKTQFCFKILSDVHHKIGLSEFKTCFKMYGNGKKETPPLSGRCTKQLVGVFGQYHYILIWG